MLKICGVGSVVNIVDIRPTLIQPSRKKSETNLVLVFIIKFNGVSEAQHKSRHMFPSANSRTILFLKKNPKQNVYIPGGLSKTYGGELLQTGKEFLYKIQKHIKFVRQLLTHKTQQKTSTP